MACGGDDLAEPFGNTVSVRFLDSQIIVDNTNDGRPW